jgi:hypothetical protein
MAEENAHNVEMYSRSCLLTNRKQMAGTTAYAVSVDEDKLAIHR